MKALWRLYKQSKAEEQITKKISWKLSNAFDLHFKIIQENLRVYFQLPSINLTLPYLDKVGKVGKISSSASSHVTRTNRFTNRGETVTHSVTVSIVI